MNPWVELLKSKRVLVNEFLDTARAVKNRKHIRLLESDIETIDKFLSWDNPTPDQLKEMELWLNL